MTTEIYCHRAYGLTIHSEIELPELLSGEAGGKPDLVIRRARIDRPVSEDPEDFVFSPDRQRLDWRAVGRFDIIGDNEIVVDGNPDVPEAILRLPLLGTVMALLLYLRGGFVLHASAVLVGDRGVGFLGDKRAGKSTTAGAMVAHGHRLITDDVLDFAFDDGVHLLPGFPQMKLTAESSSAVNMQKARRLPILDFPGFDKHRHQVTEHFFDDRVPPGRLYVLDRGPDPRVDRLTQTEAFQALMRFSYMIRFGKAVLNISTAPRMMQQCSQLAAMGLVRRLVVPDSLDRLPEAVALIEHDLGE